MRLIAWIAGGAICYGLVAGLGSAWIIIAVPLFLAWTIMLFMMGMAK